MILADKSVGVPDRSGTLRLSRKVIEGAKKQVEAAQRELDRVKSLPVKEFA
jgi:hypothetical protein